MTDKELYEAWKKRNIHSYEGTKNFATEHSLTTETMCKIINKFRDMEEQGNENNQQENINNQPVSKSVKPYNDITRLIKEPVKQEVSSMNNTENTKGRKKLTEKEIEQIKIGLAQNKKIKDIAEEIGCSCNTITVHKRRMKLEAAEEQKKQEEKIEEPKVVDKMTSVIDMLNGFKNIVDKNAQTKSIKAEVDISESSIIFDTEESEYVITIKKSELTK